MVTFLWMLYLVFTLYITIGYTFKFISRYKDNFTKVKIDKYDDYIKILISLLWSIWYFYFLH